MKVKPAGVAFGRGKVAQLLSRAVLVRKRREGRRRGRGGLDRSLYVYASLMHDARHPRLQREEKKEKGGRGGKGETCELHVCSF